jgi:hypothetical protein
VTVSGDAVAATIQGHHIEYSIGLAGPRFVIGLYVVATCGSAMASSDRRLRAFGAVNLIAGAVIAWIDARAFISLWCMWAALISGAVALHLRLLQRPEPVEFRASC